MFTFRIFKSTIGSLNISKELQSFIRKSSNNPGIDLRLKAFGPGDKNIKDEFEDLDDVETDFMDLHKSHKQHEKELEKERKTMKYYIVHEKYFKEKYPNFLTWHDKEQIRYLHRKDPDEWTIENLSNSFPALPSTIKKIVKSNWTKTRQYHITNHDISVQKQWEMFKKGELFNLPENLVEHLKKFTNRSLNFKQFQLNEASNNKIEIKTIKTGTEFSEIISNYEKLKNKSINNSNFVIKDKNPIKKTNESDTHLSSKAYSKYSISLSKYKDNLEKKAASGKLSEEQKIIRASLQNKTNSSSEIQNNKHENNFIELSQSKHENTTEVSSYVNKKTERDLSHLIIPEKIYIPKKLYKKDYLYKLNDCYYDDDGEFLYRVPGMS